MMTVDDGVMIYSMTDDDPVLTYSEELIFILLYSVIDDVWHWWASYLLMCIVRYDYSDTIELWWLMKWVCWNWWQYDPIIDDIDMMEELQFIVDDLMMMKVWPVTLPYDWPLLLFCWSPVIIDDEELTLLMTDVYCYWYCY